MNSPLGFNFSLTLPKTTVLGTEFQVSRHVCIYIYILMSRLWAPDFDLFVVRLRPPRFPHNMNGTTGRIIS